VPKDKLSAVLNNIAEFLRDLDSDEEVSEDPENEVLFMLAEEGGLHLNGNEALQYREHLKSLVDTIGSEIIGSKAIEILYRKAILTTLDIQEKRRSQPFEDRLKGSIEELRQSLTAAPTTFHVYYPVYGLALEGLPVQVGNVQFCIFKDDHLSPFIEAWSGPADDENAKENRRSVADSIRDSRIIGQPVGLVEVKALEDEAAKALTFKELTLTLDIINFFSDLIPYQQGHAYLPGNNERTRIEIPVIEQREKPNFIFNWKVVGPLMPLSFQKLLEQDKARNWGFTKIANLLAKNEKRNDLEERIVSALQWAGRATVESRKDTAFLLYAISLESLILLDNEREELTYRLRTRVAHLLSQGVENRMKLAKKIGDLYAVRSKIVHQGSYQVTDADLSLMRIYSKNCILHILNKEPFSSMDRIESLVKWFNEQILS
jgi:hypothetical protein